MVLKCLPWIVIYFFLGVFRIRSRRNSRRSECKTANFAIGLLIVVKNESPHLAGFLTSDAFWVVFRIVIVIVGC